MARPLRIEYPGAIYHVTSRGIDRRKIFNEDGDCQHLVQLLKESADFFRVEVIAYCLMSNHFHFLLQTKEANLSRYIHLNPIKVKVIREKSEKEQRIFLRRYKWSSYAEVLEPWKRSKYLRSECVLESLGGDNERGRKRYEEFVFEGIGKEIPNPMDKLRYQFLLGSDKFIEQIKTRFIKEKDLKPFYPKTRAINQQSVEKIAEVVAKSYGVSAEEILVARSKHKEARKVLIELSYIFCLVNKSLKELGQELGGISGPGIVRVRERLKNKGDKNRSLKDKISKLAKVICQ